MASKRSGSLQRWSAAYFKTGPIPTSARHLANAMHASGLGRRVKKPGLPARFPRMSLTSAGVTNAAQVLDASKAAFDAGYSYALLKAMECLVCSPDTPIPRWLLSAWWNATQLLELRVAKSIDDALGLKLPRTSASARAFREFHAQIYIDVMNAQRAGVAVDNELFEEIGKHYGASKSKIARAYTDMKREIDDVSKDR